MICISIVPETNEEALCLLARSLPETDLVELRIDRIGEPYMSTRQGAEPGGGLGLGLFIAKTLLERSGASIVFRNSSGPGEGAMVQIKWPRSMFVYADNPDATPWNTV